MDPSVPQRRLMAFRDEEDFTGVEYSRSIRDHLENSAKMLVICSPNARASDFVSDEIRLFAEKRGGQNIIPILLSGIPNNETLQLKALKCPSSFSFPPTGFKIGDLCDDGGMPNIRLSNTQ